MKNSQILTKIFENENLNLTGAKSIFGGARPFGCPLTVPKVISGVGVWGCGLVVLGLGLGYKCENICIFNYKFINCSKIFIKI